jgi:anaerobic ribonucleoside-triphosphate reductase
MPIPNILKENHYTAYRQLPILLYLKAFVFRWLLLPQLASIKVSAMTPTDIISKFLDRKMREVNNANLLISLPALEATVGEVVYKRFWFDHVFPPYAEPLHDSGAIYIHQLRKLGPYCAGFSGYDIAVKGIQTLNNTYPQAIPPKRVRSLVDQMVNFIFLVSQEVSGAVAINDFLAVITSFAYDKETNTLQDVRQDLQTVIFSLNYPFRSGNSPFTNITMTFGGPPPWLGDKAVIKAGKEMPYTYKDIPSWAYDEVNKIFLEEFAKGDAMGRPWTFPLITVYICDNHDWDNPAFRWMLENMDRWGGVYFENYITEPYLAWGLTPRDPKAQRSFCCRFQINQNTITQIKLYNGLDRNILPEHTGSIFGAGSGAGSIGVVNINFNRIVLEAQGNMKEIYKRLDYYLECARGILNAKRQFILANSDLYPTFFGYVNRDLSTYFNTISTIGGHEGLVNMGIEDGILSDEGLKIAKEIAQYITDKLDCWMKEDGIPWNYEYAPAETAAGVMAQKDKALFGPHIFLSGLPDSPILTAGWQPPFSEGDIVRVVYTSAHTQHYATGGSVLHLFLGDGYSADATANLLRKIFTNFPVIYMTMSPELTICEDCGHKKVGRFFQCIQCGSPNTTTWARVIGYFRPVATGISYNGNGKWEAKQLYWQRAKMGDYLTRAILD